MARGRTPKPIEQKIREGTLQSRDKKTPLVIGGRELPKPSEHLSDIEKDRFHAIVESLKDSGILDTADRGMIELAAMEEANIVECNTLLAEHDAFIEHTQDRGATNLVEHPAKASKRKSIQALRQIYAEIGIGPASRARLKGLGVETAKATRTKEIPGLQTAHDIRLVKTG